MSFIWPQMLVFLLFVPVLIVAYIYMQRRRQRIRARYGAWSLPQARSREPGRLRHIPAVLFLAGQTLLLVVLARPQMTVNLPRYEGTVILAFDVSGSMAAQDLQPNRIEAAKAAAVDFVKHLPSTVQIGVVAFSESGLSVQAPTNDQDKILASIDRLKSEQGTSLGYGILTALNTLGGNNGESQGSGAQNSATPVPQGSEQSAVIVLLTDGENTAPPDPFEAAFKAAERGVRIYTIGIGSPQGTTLHINGYTVHTQLNETALQQIAGLTGGEYYNASSPEELSQVYQKLSPELVIKPEKTEVTSIFAGASLVILLLGGGLMLLWFGRLP